MKSKEIISGSKLIAEYLGWKYIPFNDLQGYSCAGWWKIAKPGFGGDDLGRYMLAKTRNHKDKLGRNYYVCRNHGELRFWNSLDALVPVIQKIEKEYNINFYLFGNGCGTGYGSFDISVRDNFSSYDLPNWSNNVFKVIVEYLKTK